MADTLERAAFELRYDPFVREEYDQPVAWQTGQGEILTAATCVRSDEQPEVGIRISCSHDTVTQAIDSPPVPTISIFTVVDDRIVALDLVHVGIDFVHAGGPFNDWLESHHPDVPGARFGEWTSFEEASEHGEVRAEYAELWADYLDANGCTYLDRC